MSFWKWLFKKGNFLPPFPTTVRKSKKRKKGKKKNRREKKGKETYLLQGAVKWSSLAPVLLGSRDSAL